MERHSPATKYAWMGIGLFVLVYDFYAPETLSGGVDYAIEASPVTRAAALGGIALTALHLANLIPKPEKYDPFTRLPRKLNRLGHDS